MKYGMCLGYQSINTLTLCVPVMCINFGKAQELGTRYKATQGQECINKEDVLH